MNEFEASRKTLHRVAAHVVARSRVEATGRFSLRVTPGGFGTPDLPPDGTRVRIAGDRLVVESDAPGAAAVRSHRIHGATLAELAAFAGVDLAQPLDVGHDTPPPGDVDAPLPLPSAGALAVAEWYGMVAAMLDAVVGALAADATPTLPRLWPEHFDVAVEAQAHPDRRVNLGGSPGDGFSAEPYLYVGPWTSDRPGDPAFWNAPFGASCARTELPVDRADAVAAGVAFLLDGYRRLS